MMIGLSGSLAQAQPGDICLDISTLQTAPCSSGDPNFLAFSDPSGGVKGPISQMGPTGALIPVLALADILQRCNTTNCQIASATPQTFATGGPCDPLVMAAGYSCQGSGNVAIYQKQTGTGGNLQNGQLYTDQGTVTAPSANQYYLTPQQTQYLIANGIIAPVTNMNQPLNPALNPSPPSTGPGASAQVQWAFTTAGQPAANQLPVYSTTPTAAPMTPSPTGPLTVPLGITPAPSTTPAGGMMPGGGTAASTGGPGSMAPTGSGTGTSGSGTSGDLISGISNQTLLIGAAALIALLAVMK